MITLKTTHGDIQIKLDTEKSPITTQNFLDYVNEGFYNGVIFHRVIDGFMIQTGGFEPGMTEKKTKANIKNEASNGLSNKRGTIAMARTPDPHSASAQFFINLKDNNFLDFKNETPNDWGYCVFGEVVEGMETVDKIAKVSTGSQGGHGDVPQDDVVIQEAVVTAEA